MFATADVQHGRCRLVEVVVRNGRDGQHTTPRWDRMIIAAALYHVRDGSSIDLKMERQIPSKVRNPQNNQTRARLSGGSSRRDYANENKNQKESGGGGVSRPHAMGAARFWIARRSSTSGVRLVDCPDAGRPTRPAILPQLPGGQPRP